MKEFKAPEDPSGGDFPTVFLAGTIDMGNSADWQAEIVKNLEDKKGSIFNPRRSNWDPSWEQSIDNPQFYEQVMWELEHSFHADHVLMYFAKDSKSPITLLELGHLNDHDGLIVVCEEGFYRKGNVEIYCEYASIPFYTKLEEALGVLRRRLS